MTDEAKAPGTTLTPFGQGVFLDADTFFVGQQQRIFTSFDVTTEDGKAAVATYLQGGVSKPLADMIGEQFEIQDMLLHVVQIESEKEPGVMEPAIRTVLVDADGNAYSATSGGVAKSMQFLIGLWGNPPFNPPKRVKIVQTNTRKGRRVFNIVPIINAKVNGKGAKAK